ncbi:aldehyde dehydrogenase family protein [Prochlorococcus marinus]|uniref:aldehyde dehydrogenase family protein n=1 Tax=Prochlorococcus marinus TaxID=1219 RepID=UPI0022B457A1|nr:aldehyde dehydrogenase family protein [Prochlorococcus marinus]
MQEQKFTIEDLRKIVSSGETRSESWRRLQLKRLSNLLNQNQNAILKALYADLQKPQTEAFFEILALKQELKVCQQKLSKWMKPKSIEVPLWLKPGKAYVINEPLGCVLVIGAWNYPFMLSLHPLISALAAGNTAVLKPSEYAPATSGLIEKLISQTFPNNVVRVLQGDEHFSEKLLSHNFDHIFFTGGTETGRKIMAAAAKTLTPITLELGGKNPAVVLEGADINTTAKRLVWGKSLNAGQTCLAPNHLFVQREIRTQLIEKLKFYINSFYGENPNNSDNIASINKRQFKRVIDLINNAKAKNQILHGGEVNLNERKVSPTIISLNDSDDSFIKEEIFGPILPIWDIQNIDHAINLIREQSKPLSIYMFGGSNQDKEKLLRMTSSGGVCFNDVIMHAGIPELPFGGVGDSGTGRYHGQAGFETFSHQKSVLDRPFWLDLKFRYPPYNIDISFLNRIMR